MYIFFFFFDLGFTALSRIFHLYRADRSSKVGENRSTRRKTTWPSVSRTWLSHIWPELGSNHSGEKPNGLRVNSLIHQATGARSRCISYLPCYNLVLLPLIICLGRLCIACTYIFNLWQLRQCRLFGSVVRALDFYPGRPCSNPTTGGKFFQLCFIPLLWLSCHKMGARPRLDFT